MMQAVPGDTLIGDVGLWVNGATGYNYQLDRNGIVFQFGAWGTGPTYLVQESDVGFVISITVFAINRNGTSLAANSIAVSIIADPGPHIYDLMIFDGMAVHN